MAKDCLMLLASVGMGLTAATPVYAKDIDALSATKVEQEKVDDSSDSNREQIEDEKNS